MVTSKKRSSVTVSKSAIDQATETLQSLPDKPKQGWSLREAIDQMNGVITLAIEKGYSYEELVNLLHDQGIEISVSSLKNYLTRSKRENAASAKATAKTATKATGKRRGRKPKSSLVESIDSDEGTDQATSVLSGDRPDLTPPNIDEPAEDTPEPIEPAVSGEEEPAKRGRRTRSSARAKTQSGTNQTQVSATNGRKTRRKKNESVAS